MGHSGASDSELFNRYGNEYFEPDFLFEILEKVQYSEIEFSCLNKEILKVIE